MSAAETLVGPLVTCANPTKHSPTPLIYDLHHVIPESWQGPTDPGNLVTLCVQCHHSTHILIDLYVKLGRKPTRGEVHDRFGCYGSEYLHTLADQAWANHPNPPTYTS